MRKNTLIKLLAVLAMCFLIGAALVSCGEGEAENADVKTIVSINFSGDKLVVAYNDGTTASVDLPKAEACNHENAIVLVFEEHTANSDGEYLYVCNECGASEVKYEKNHKFVADNKTVAPTCTEEGYTTTHSCEFCGIPSEKTDVLPANGHTMGDYAFVEGDACQGGTLRSDCAYCDHFETKTQAAADDSDFDGIHTVETWYVAEGIDPTYTNGAKVVGLCTVDGCLNPVVTKDIGALPNQDSNTEYTYDKANSDLYESCGDAADYLYIHKETGLEFHVVVAADAVVKHELNGKKMTSAEQVVPGTEFESAYFVDEIEGEILFANYELTCNGAVLAHFYCTAKHDGGKVCGEDITIYVKAKHTTVDSAWVTVPGQQPACKVPVTQAQNCTKCGTVVTKELPLQAHNFEYNSNVLYAKDGDNYVAGFDPSLEANIAKVPYYRGVCEYCGEFEYKTVTDYAYAEVKAATCQGNGEGKVTYTLTDGTAVTVKVVLAQFAHKMVGGEAIKSAESSDYIYNADDPKYADLIYVPDNVKAQFEAGEKVECYIHCDCTCEGCAAHDVTVWAQKLGAPADEE